MRPSVRVWVAAIAALLHGPVFAGPALVLYYEPLRGEAGTSHRSAQKQSSQFSYAFEAFGRRFDLTLTRNERIALAKTSTAGGPSLLLYQGAVDDVPNSWVRLGVRGEHIEGLIWDGQDLYVIESVEAAREEIAPPLGLPESGSIVFRLSDTRLDAPASCAATHSTPKTGLDQYKAVLQEIAAAAPTIAAARPSMRIELSAIGDALYRQGHTSEQSARDEILLRLNNVDGIFSSQIGVAIQVPTVSIEPPDGTLFSTTTASNTLLTELAQVRKTTSELRNRGLTHLFTGRDLDSDTVGVAYIDALCDPQYGVGLTQTANLTLWLESLVAAHEIGHNFGAYHDGVDAPGNNPGECPSTPANLYLMAALVDGNHDRFSDCSRNTMWNTMANAACVTPISTADVAVASNIGDVRALVGESFEWSFDVANVGSAAANGARAKAILPPTFTITEAWVVGGTCTSGAGVIDCNLGTVAGNVTRTIHTRLHSDIAASNTVVVQVSATNDAAINNNQGQGNIDIEIGVDLAIALAAPSTLQAGQTGEGTVTIENVSSVSAQNVVIDFTSTNLALRSASLEGATCAQNGAGLRCTLITIDANSQRSGTLTFEGTAAGAATLSAQITSAGLDSNSANNSASASLQTSSTVSQVTSNSSSGGGGGGAMGWFLLLLGLLSPCVRRIGSSERRGRAL